MSESARQKKEPDDPFEGLPKEQIKGDYRQQSVPIEATEAPYETDATKASYGGSTVVEDDLFDDLLSEEPETEEPETPPVERALGLNVSRFQKGVEWQFAAQDGISFAFIKASQGDSRADSKFAVHWAYANTAGILRGAYHYYEPGVSPTRQAEHFYKTVAETGDFGELPPVLDMEQTSISADEVRECLSEIERLFGKKPIIYTRAMFWDSLGPTPWAEAYPLWLAHYPEQKWEDDTLARMRQRAPSGLPSSWATWTFWHFSHKAPGSVYGISGNVDLNFFNGTVEQLRAFATTGAPPVETDLLSFALNDRPGGPDRLGYDDYARAFAQVIGSPHTKTPLTIGIYAAWGMGKSFLLGKIKEQLAAAGDDFEFHFVDFNAWEYSGSENLWAGLITRLYSKVEKAFEAKDLRLFRYRQSFYRARKRVLSWGSVVMLGGILLALFLDPETQAEWGTVQTAFRTLVGTTAIGGSTIAALSALVRAFRDLTESAAPRSEQLAANASRPDFREKIGFMEEIKKELKDIRKLIDSEGKKKRFVIFVDDLDRCPPKKAVEVLEAIMLLLSDEDGDPFVVFLAIDARVLVKAVEERYGKVLTEAGITGYEFLEKIVQIPFRIPPPGTSAMETYVKSLLWHTVEAQTEAEQAAAEQQAAAPGEGGLPGDGDSAGGGVAGDGAQRQTSAVRQSALPEAAPEATPIPPVREEAPFSENERAAFETFSSYFSPNPRRAKRIVNVYRIVRLLAPEQTAVPEKLIKWVITSEQWPFRAAWMMQKVEDDIQLAQGLAARKDTALPEIYALVRAKVEAEKAKDLATLDDDPEQFLKFIAGAPAITVEDIHTLLRPLTFNLNPAMQSEVLKEAVQNNHKKATP